MTDGTFAALPSWASSRSELTFTTDALNTGRQQAIDVWNRFPTDVNGSTAGTYEPVLSYSAGATPFIEAAAYSYALLNESIRMDSLKIPIQGSGLVGDPVAVTPTQIASAQAATVAFERWVAMVKPRMAGINLGV